jgi:hypothetical protein
MRGVPEPAAPRSTASAIRSRSASRPTSPRTRPGNDRPTTGQSNQEADPELARPRPPSTWSHQVWTRLLRPFHAIPGIRWRVPASIVGWAPARRWETASLLRRRPGPPGGTGSRRRDHRVSRRARAFGHVSGTEARALRSVALEESEERTGAREDLGWRSIERPARRMRFLGALLAAGFASIPGVAFTISSQTGTEYILPRWRRAPKRSFCWRRGPCRLGD